MEMHGAKNERDRDQNPTAMGFGGRLANPTAERVADLATGQAAKQAVGWSTLPP